MRENIRVSYYIDSKRRRVWRIVGERKHEGIILRYFVDRNFDEYIFVIRENAVNIWTSWNKYGQ